MPKLNPDLPKSLNRPASDLEFLSGLDAAGQEQLLADIDTARGLHRDHIRQALEDALNHVPRLIRGPLRKIFGA